MSKSKFERKIDARVKERKVNTEPAKNWQDVMNTIPKLREQHGDEATIKKIDEATGKLIAWMKSAKCTTKGESASMVDLGIAIGEVQIQVKKTKFEIMGI